jgi:hypothetical protein
LHVSDDVLPLPLKVYFFELSKESTLETN